MSNNKLKIKMGIAFPLSYTYYFYRMIYVTQEKNRSLRSVEPCTGTAGTHRPLNGDSNDHLVYLYFYLFSNKDGPIFSDRTVVVAYVASKNSLPLSVVDNNKSISCTVESAVQIVIFTYFRSDGEHQCPSRVV